MRKITRRSFLAAAAACGAAAALTACGGSSASSAVASAAADGQKFTIGICQLVQHAALDAATQGFEDALTASFGENVTFDFQNAQGDSATCATITNGFVSAGVDLIMANATPALQAAQSATNTIPVLGTSVTEYGVALGLTDFDGIVGGNISVADNLGIKARNYIWSAYIFQGLFAAIGGVVMMTRQFSASGNLALQGPMEVIPMVIVGGTSMAGGRGGALKTVGGVVLLKIIYNAMTMFSIPAPLQPFVKGLILLVVIVSDKYMERRHEKV